jgi:SEC-C motif-containing protein
VAAADPCPCGSGDRFDGCCAPALQGTPSPTAEALMRSRYTAYVKHDVAHLERSLSADQRKDFAADEAKKWAESSEWLGLNIIRTEQGGPDDKLGAVHFAAKFKTEGEEREHLEVALFGREDGRWVYTGQVDEPGKTVRRETPKVGRNDPCPCGSGKKYKKCCGVAA